MVESDLEIGGVKMYSSFDVKGFLLRLLSYWYLIVISILISVGVAYYINLKTQRLYRLDTLISIKEEQNPLFTSSMSLTFNWGGASDQVETVRTILKSRTHNDRVVRLTQLYIHYMVKGRFRMEDIHHKAPFKAQVDETDFQLFNAPIKIVFNSPQTFKFSYDLGEEKTPAVIRYADDSKQLLSREYANVNKEYRVGQTIKEPFFNGSIELNGINQPVIGKVYYLRFTDVNAESEKFRKIDVSLEVKGASMLRLELVGPNKDILADYLNATVDILRKDQLDQKNLFATNTLNFITEQLAGVSDSLKNSERNLRDFRQDNQIFDLSSKGSMLNSKLTSLEVEQKGITSKMAYLNLLRDYLQSSEDYSNLPAPGSSGIDDPNIILNVKEIVTLSVGRDRLRTKIKDEAYTNKYDNDITALKNVLLENIRSAKSKLNIDMAAVEADMERARFEFNKLPVEEQKLYHIQRKYEITQTNYNMLLDKQQEARLIRAANVSDVKVIDEAKNLNQGPLNPNKSKNYFMGFLAGILIPLVLIFIITLLDTKINGPQEVERLTKVPIIGVIGHSFIKNNLAVFERNKSAIAESFRSVRSSLQYLFRMEELKGEHNSQTIMITSSVSGEGKTFFSINLASVFSLSNKKTVLIGLDLRKPKIFGDFHLNNKVGAVNYLIGEKTLEEVIEPSGYENLDIITSGPLPPNPSELLIGERMNQMMKQLKEMYDVVVLDTAPLGLVADSLELTKYVDITLYIVRHNYSKKEMLNIVNEKRKKGEIGTVGIVLNDYVNKSKYGYRYGYGYGYGYGSYNSGYHENEKADGVLKRIWRIIKK